MKIKARTDVYEPLTKERYDREMEIGIKKLHEDGYAKSIFFDASSRIFIIYFSDNTLVSLPVDDYPEFTSITSPDLSKVRIGFAGSAICLDEHDLHVSIDGLLNDNPSVSRSYVIDTERMISADFANAVKPLDRKKNKISH